MPRVALFWLFFFSFAVIVAGGGRGPVLAGAHYFAGWSRVQGPGNFSHFHGVTPTGQVTDNWFQTFPERTPLLGLYSTEATVAREVAAADTALDFFDMLYFEGGSDCGPNPDAGLSWCLNSPLAFMLNSSTIWQNTSRLHFFISYVYTSTEYPKGDASENCFVGTAGDHKWASLVKTWVAAMAHPRYLKVNHRPVFKILDPRFLLTECGKNATLATLRLGELRAAAIAHGVGDPLIGKGWQNPSIAAGTPKPHPHGFIEFKDTEVDCAMSGCTISELAVETVHQCQALCNSTAGCVAVTVSHNNESCALLNSSGRGQADPAHDTWVRTVPTIAFDFTGTYSAAPVINRTTHQYLAKYKDSWWPNHSKATGAEIFPYTECSAYQGAARLNHSNDRVPYLPNVVAGFDPRPWQEHAPSFTEPTEHEWAVTLQQIRTQVLEPANRFGFPDASAPHGYQPAFTIYAWNEFGEGGILAPTQRQKHMKLETLAKVLGRTGLRV
jgi:hypothetical protein